MANILSVEPLSEAILRRYRELCQRKGLCCSQEMQGVIAAAVRMALYDILDTTGSAAAAAAAAQQALTEAQRKAYQEFRMPGVRLKAGDLIIGDGPTTPKVIPVVSVKPDDPAHGGKPRAMDFDLSPEDSMADIRERVSRRLTELYDQAIMADSGYQDTVSDTLPSEGNPYSDLPLGVPAALGPNLNIYKQEAIVESVRQQYGEQAARVEEARLKALSRDDDSVNTTTRLMSMEYPLSVPPDAGAIERSIYAILEEIGYPCAEGGRPGRLSVAARLAEEVAEAGATSVDGRSVIGRLQALHNVNWLLRHKFPPEKITARKIAGLGVPAQSRYATTNPTCRNT